MEIVVKGRNIDVPDHYRQHVIDKLGKVVRFDRKIVSVDVELLHERNPRQQDSCQRVEITCITLGPVVRAEAAARDFHSALDDAINKLTTRLRRAADRRKTDRRQRAPLSAAVEELAAPEVTSPAGEAEPDSEQAQWPAVAAAAEAAHAAAEAANTHLPWRIVREKEHPGDPMTVEDALFHMELVGHDFYLFRDKDSGAPSVVYRRKAYDYGVISLAEPQPTT